MLTRKGWRFAGLGRDTNWGRPGTRSFVASEDGGVAYCRNVGPGTARRGVACTTLDPDTLTWGYDRIAGPTDRTLEEDRTWVSTGEGPALCGRTGSLAHQRVGCTVLTDAGWTFVGLGPRHRVGPRRVARVRERRRRHRVLLPPDRRRGNHLRASCTPFYPTTLSWGYDRISQTPDPTADDNRTWVTTAAGPALCGRTGTERDQRLGCSVLTDAGWTFKGWAAPSPGATRPVVPSSAPGDNGVSYCRTVAGPAGDRAACTRFDAARDSLGRRPGRRGRRAHPRRQPHLAGDRLGSRAVRPHRRPGAPALCRACSVLTPLRLEGLSAGPSRRRNAAWGNIGTYVTSDEGKLSYCRSLTPPAGRPAGLHGAGGVRTGVGSQPRLRPARLTISDPF